jgi:DNA polymerase-3 subunit alpha
MDNLRDQEIAIAGIVTDVQHRVSKKGSPFGTITIEDYEGTIKLSLFSETYMKFKHLLVFDAVIYVKGKNSKSWKDDGEYEFRVNEIRLLDEIRNEKVKGICINLPVDQITEKFMSELNYVCNQYEGNQLLAVNILDLNEKIKLTLHAQSKKINADSLFINALERMGVDYYVF